MLKISEAVIVTSRSISVNPPAGGSVGSLSGSHLNTLWLIATGGFMVIEMVIVIKVVFRPRDEGNHFGYGGDDYYDHKASNTTYGYFHMAALKTGNMGATENVIVFVLYVFSYQ